MRKFKWVIIFLNLLLLLVYFHYSVKKKEEILNEGQLVLLELAPVDPRSLMQGDYMNLRYGISERFDYNNIPKRGYCVVVLDQDGRGEGLRFQQNLTPLHENEYLIEYTSSDRWNIHIGAESFFFQEGDAEKYEMAKYGGIKVDDKGNSILIGLYDEQFQKIE
ncbi:MAG: GDYXXLXY domain-containing protein [Bacteroidota bacterium]